MKGLNGAGMWSTVNRFPGTTEEPHHDRVVSGSPPFNLVPYAMQAAIRLEGL